ncbi:MAG: Flp pilus assembly complex ATPase component TadA [Gemmatimonadetes bacterium]|nr:Flp pilus assembly complex ATPase component TadA [Gemmatimonadota bacterium]
MQVLRRGGLPDTEELDLDPGMPAAEAWMTVCDMTGITQDRLAQHVADYFRLKVATLDTAEPNAIKLVPEKIARQYLIFPMKEDDRQLTVATSDPTNFAAEQALGFISGRKAVFEVAPPPFILDFINASYSPDGVIESLLSRVDEAIASSVSVMKGDDQDAVTEAEAESAPVIKLTNLILRDAAMNGASDVHIEPGASGGTVRFRIDGVLRNYMQLPLPALIRVVSRIKIMGNLDIADKWRPHDGRTRVMVEGRPYDIRISTVPTREAEKVVLRILKGGQAAKLSEIGLPAWELGRLRQLLSNRDGIVCVTGPTGSGKTTTLYAAIRELATGEVNIMTVEDPVEYELPGITQIQVQPKRGVTFAGALRAILRQDPDVILVGEIRDQDTAQVAVQAAMTGHLVLATLHTNDAVSVVARLLDIGLDRASIAATLRGALAQRLVRKVCDECGEPIRGEMTEDEIRLAKLYNLRPPIRSVGCRRCAETGYRGRIPVQEVFVVNTTISDLINGGGTYSELYAASVSSGMRPLLHVGLERVRSGETTLDELERVLGLEAEETAASSEAPERQRDEAYGAEPAAAARAEPDLTPPAETIEPEDEPLPVTADASPLRAGVRAPDLADDDDIPIIDLDQLEADLGTGGSPAVAPPLAREQVEEALPRTARPPSGLSLGGGSEEAPILVVDDDPEDRLLVRTILQKHGFRVEEARDGDEALLMIGMGDTHALVVLDLEMPTLDGREVLHRLRSSGSTIALPVIVLTGSPDPDDEYRLMEAGADDYLRKPLDPPRFIARVRATLRRARMT